MKLRFNLIFGGLVCIIILTAAVFAPLLAHYNPVLDADLMNAELPPDAQIALTLREACGLLTEEIATAFLAKPSATTAQGVPLWTWITRFVNDDAAWASTKP